MDIHKLRHRLTIYLEQLKALSFPDTDKALGRCDVLLACHDVDRGETLQGRAYSRLIDSVAVDLTDRGWVCKQFAWPYSHLVGNRAWGQPVSAHRRNFLAGIILRLLRLSVRLKVKALQQSLAYHEQHEQRFYAALLTQTACRCVIAIGAPPALCQAGRQVNIPVVELLHGIGYTPVPWNWDSIAAHFLPTKILSLDEVSTKTFASLAHKGVAVRQIPHPWFARFTDPELRAGLPEVWRNVPQWLQTDRRVIIVALQWGYAGEYPPLQGILPNGLLHDELIRAIALTPSVLWLFRLHPVQLRRRYYHQQRQFIDRLTKTYTNCEWQQASTLPLPLLLSCCHGHITMTSMTAYEAAFLGVPSLLLCPTLQSGACYEYMFQDLRQAGYATLGAFNAEAIAAWAHAAQRRNQPFQTEKGDDWETTVAWMLGATAKH